MKKVLVIIAPLLILLIGGCTVTSPAPRPEQTEPGSPPAQPEPEPAPAQPEINPGQQQEVTPSPGLGNQPEPTPETTGTPATNSTYVIVDTGQAECYNNAQKITCPQYGESFYGQDAQYTGAQPAYRNNGDYPQGRGPQGDAIRIYNFVRCVRDAA